MQKVHFGKKNVQKVRFKKNKDVQKVCFRKNDVQKVHLKKRGAKSPLSNDKIHLNSHRAKKLCKKSI